MLLDGDVMNVGIFSADRRIVREFGLLEFRQSLPEPPPWPIAPVDDIRPRAESIVFLDRYYREPLAERSDRRDRC